MTNLATQGRRRAPARPEPPPQARHTEPNVPSPTRVSGSAPTPRSLGISPTLAAHLTRFVISFIHQFRSALLRIILGGILRGKLDQAITQLPPTPPPTTNSTHLVVFFTFYNLKCLHQMTMFRLINLWVFLRPGNVRFVSWGLKYL